MKLLGRDLQAIHVQLHIVVMVVAVAAAQTRTIAQDAGPHLRTRSHGVMTKVEAGGPWIAQRWIVVEDPQVGCRGPPGANARRTI